jgi:hypothetical protein
MCFVRISEQTATFALLNIKRLVFITEVESVYSAVRTESLHKTDTVRPEKVKNAKSIMCVHICTCVCVCVSVCVCLYRPQISDFLQILTYLHYIHIVKL